MVEKTAILTFEQHLADACNKETIGESNSLLLTSLITMDPNGALRRPPQMILDTLQQYNAHYKIGHLLCRSRGVIQWKKIVSGNVGASFGAKTRANLWGC